MSHVVEQNRNIRSKLITMASHQIFSKVLLVVKLDSQDLTILDIDVLLLGICQGIAPIKEAVVEKIHN